MTQPLHRRLAARAGLHAELLGVLALYLGFAGFTLLEYPPVYTDEPWVLAPAVSIVRTGENALPMFGESYSPLLYFNYYAAAFVKVLGASIEAGRIMSVAHGAGILVLVYAISMRLGATRTAFIAPALLVGLFPFVEGTRFVRPDAVETFYALLAVWLFLWSRGRQPLATAFAGLAVGIALAMYFPAAWVLVVLYIWLLAERASRVRIASFSGGIGVALIPWLIFLLGDLAEYRRFLQKFGATSVFSAEYSAVDPLSSLWRSVRAEPERYRAVAAWADSDVYLLVVVAVIVLVAGVAMRARLWLPTLLVVVPLLMLATVGVSKAEIYFIRVVPGIAVLAAIALSRVPLRVAAAAVAVVGLAYAGVVADRVTGVTMKYDEVGEAYRAAYPFPGGSLVIGFPVAYGYFMADPEIEFRSLHFFTGFADFSLDVPAESRRKLERESRTRPVFLIPYDWEVFFSTMRRFAPDDGSLTAFRRFIESSFEPVASVTVENSAFGSYRDTILLYIGSTRQAQRLGVR